jgi:hypothetical protein
VVRANRNRTPLQLLGAVGVLAASVAFGTGSSAAQQLSASGEQHETTIIPAAKPRASVSSETRSIPDVKPVRSSAAKGPYYVDFRARTAASYGHAFVWFGKTSERKVEVAGLHPAGDETPYILGHLIWVPAETGASYGDLDVQYLTANYRVYLNEPDAKKVFAYIKHLQATSKVWNAQTSNCTNFIGQIATFMGLKVPFHLKRPEEYVKDLKEMNGGRQTAQLTSDR